jgi:PEGA domain
MGPLQLESPALPFSSRPRNGRVCRCVGSRCDCRAGRRLRAAGWASILAFCFGFAAARSGHAADGPTRGASTAAQLRVEIEGDRGEIFIDGESMGHGKFNGQVESGRHELRVTREGHDSFEKTLVLSPGEVHSESVTLKPSVAEVMVEGGVQPPRALDGIYGGIQLLAAFVPRGSGSTFQDACDSIGATRCAPGSITTGGISGYIGYMLEPIGLELAMLGSGDFSGPSATFNGVVGSEINPVVAEPAREEKFTIAGFGGGAMLRVRLATKVSRFRFNFAVGPGLAYRVFVMRRDTEAADGRIGFYSDVGTSYVSALLSLEASLAFELGGSTAISMGVASWFEHAGDDTTSRAEERAVLTANDGKPPIPQSTPPYDLANGPQWFVGPFLGLTFGP